MRAYPPSSLLYVTRSVGQRGAFPRGRGLRPQPLDPTRDSRGRGTRPDLPRPVVWFRDPESRLRPGEVGSRRRPAGERDVRRSITAHPPLARGWRRLARHEGSDGGRGASSLPRGPSRVPFRARARNTSAGTGRPRPRDPPARPLRPPPPPPPPCPLSSLPAPDLRRRGGVRGAERVNVASERASGRSGVRRERGGREEGEAPRARGPLRVRASRACPRGCLPGPLRSRARRARPIQLTGRPRPGALVVSGRAPGPPVSPDTWPFAPRRTRWRKSRTRTRWRPSPFPTDAGKARTKLFQPCRAPPSTRRTLGDGRLKVSKRLSGPPTPHPRHLRVSGGRPVGSSISVPLTGRTPADSDLRGSWSLSAIPARSDSLRPPPDRRRFQVG